MSTSDTLRRALHREAASLSVRPDPAGLDGALGAADRRRRRRTVLGAGLVATVLLAVAVAGAGVLDRERGAIVTPPADGGRPGPTTPPPTTAPVTPAPAADEVPPVADAVPAAPAAATPAASGVAPAVAPPLPAAASEPPPAPAPVPADEPAPTPSLSAAAAFGSCGEDPPYDDYSGTAAPGAVITITSPYSAPVSVTADTDGHWSTRVTFPSAPVGTSFTVTASTPGAASVAMSFVRTA